MKHNKLFLTFAFTLALILLVSSVSAQRFEDNYFRYGTIKPDGTLVTTNTAITNVNVIGFICTSDYCQTVSGRLWPNILTSSTDFMRLVYPTTLQSQYGYGVYVYKDGYIPYEISADWWGTNPNDPVGPYNDYLTRKEVCTSKVMSMDAIYTDHIINVQTQVRSPISNAGPLDYIPAELGSAYSANSQATLEIKKDNTIIYTETKSLNTPFSGLKDLTFSVPNITQPGTYTVKVYTTVNNEPKCLSFNQDYMQKTIVIPPCPECDEDSDCGVIHYSDNYCENNNVYRDKHQPVCNNGVCGETIIKELVETCSSTCTNNQCDHNIVCTQNSDCGTDGCLGNPNYCIGNNVFQDFIYYTCHNPGTEQSYCTNSISPFLMETCSTDYDSANYCDGNNLYKDVHDFSCSTGSCHEQTTKQLVQTCTNGCSNNACISLCSQNSDCGTDSYIGDRFCKSGDVYQNYKSFICNNPNTAQSTCSYIIEESKLDSCHEYGCTNGQCNQPECTDDSNCPAGKFCINNICVLPVCSQNSDCGQDGCAGDPNYCIGKNVFQDFRIFTCHNPGQKNSYCTNQTSPFLMETCPDNYYSTAFCENNNLYKNLHNFGCSLGSCFETITKELFQTCSNGCNATTNTCNQPTTDTTAPVITLLTPLNNTSAYKGQINFLFNVTDTSSISRCDLVIEHNNTEMVMHSINNVSKTQTNTLSHNFEMTGLHKWRVICSDEFNNSGTSEKRTLTIIENTQPVCQTDANCGNATTELICRNGDVTTKTTTPKCSFNILTLSYQCTNQVTYQLEETCEHGCKITNDEAMCKASSSHSSSDDICYDENGEEIDCSLIDSQTQTRRTTSNYEPTVYASSTQTNQSTTQQLSNLTQSSNFKININYLIYTITGLIALITIILIILLLTRKPRRRTG